MLPAKTRFSLMKYVFSSHFNGFRFSVQHANLRYEKLSSACAIIFKFFAWWCYAKHRSVFFSQIIANNWCCTCANYKISRFAIVKWKERKKKIEFILRISKNNNRKEKNYFSKNCFTTSTLNKNLKKKKIFHHHSMNQNKYDFSFHISEPSRRVLYFIYSRMLFV